jgi:2-dehydropantoate 2-reductase
VYRDTAEAAASESFDYVLCASKAFLDAVPSLSEQLAPVVGPGTTIVLLQNGAGNEAPLHASFPSTPIISAVVWTGAKALPDTDGVPTFAQFAAEGLTIGVDYTPQSDRKADGERLRALTGWFEAAGGGCTLTEDIQTERWIKLVWNCAWNALTTVTRVRTGHIFGSSDGAGELSLKLMREVTAVARAKGLAVPENTPEELLVKCKGMPGAGLPSSMMMDNEAGRPMEVEVILGTPLREGQRLGVPVPILET